MNRSNFLTATLLFLICSSGFSQDPQRFKDEVDAIQEKYKSEQEQTKQKLLFTGSSSVRLWENLESSFPDYHVLNTGFGGSQTSDLLAYLDELVLQYKPNQVFVYEGDNDIAEKKKPGQILKTTKKVVDGIKNAGYGSIVLISAKPSIERWHLRGKYKRFNRKLKKLCEEDSALEFADVWNPMLNNNKLRTELFIEDGLHMNQEGYDIWYAVIARFVN